jgi:hypothetical protein
MTHQHDVPVKLIPAMIESVDGLAARLPSYVDATDESSLPQAWGCGHSCDYVKIFGCSFLVDFTSGTILDDPNSKPCDRKSALDGSPGTGSSPATTGQKAIKHARVDVASVLDKFRKDKLQRPPQISVYDEDLLQAVGADKAMQLQSPEKIPASSFLTGMRTLAIQVGEVITANTAASAASLVKNQSRTVRTVTIKRDAVAAEAPDGVIGIDVVHKNTLSLLSVQRGLLEFADHAALTHRTFFASASCAFNDFMTKLFASLRPDIAEITSIIQNPDTITKDISSNIDSNTFYVAGVLALTGNKPALEAFFRKEKARFETVAKAAGWKPADKPKKAAGESSPAASISPAARPSPVADKQSLSGNKRDRDGTTQDDEQPDGGKRRRPGSGKFRPRKGKGGKPTDSKASG